jgi:hypothetical protein
MRARDVGSPSLSATPVTPSAADTAASQLAAGSQPQAPAVGTTAAPAPAPAGQQMQMGAVAPSQSLGGAVPGQVAQADQAGGTAAGYMAAQGMGPRAQRGTATQVAAQPAASPFRFNSQAARLETSQIAEGAYETWTGPHDYNGQPVDLKYVLNYSEGAASWQPTSDLRLHTGGQNG